MGTDGMGKGKFIGGSRSPVSSNNDEGQRYQDILYLSSVSNIGEDGERKGR